MELSLTTDGSFSVLRILGSVSLGETGALSEYLRVARENGAVGCVVDLSGCDALPTTIVALFSREASAFEAAGGQLALSGVRDQNPFLTGAAVAGRFPHYRTLDEARAAEASRPRNPPPAAPAAPS